MSTMSESYVQQLFVETLRGDYEDDAPWEAVRKLRQLGTREVFDAATQWCSSEDPLMRARAIDVLAQLGKTVEHPINSFPDESYSVVTNLLRGERELRPLNSAIAALGHLHDGRAVPLIAQFRSHPNAETRFAVACALGSFPNETLSVEMLLALVADTDAGVRDWATFGLGVLGDCDSAEIREALVQRLGDPDEDVREEAMVGLAKRRDSRVLTTLLRALEQPTVSDRGIEAAYLMLGMDNEREGWKPADYAGKLHEQFGI
jgi:HEAT repeat protein